MKTPHTIVLIILLFVSHFVSGQTENITLDEIYVTLSLQDENLRDLIRKIETSTDLMFTFQYDQVKKINNLSLPLGTRTVKDILDQVLLGTPLIYKQVNERMVVVYRSDKAEPKEEPILVTGRVVDEEGNDIADANVFIKGKNIGTTTKDGSFSIYALKNDVLVFSHVCCKAAEAVVGRKVINQVLQPLEGALQEVEVNAGYWAVRESQQTGNVSRINTKDIETHSVANPLQFLQGRMPGVYVQQNSGIPGGNVAINIRGRNSLRYEGNYPLYLIDGVPFPASAVSTNTVSNGVIPEASAMTHINPADIESIEVLKDADATAIYGTRGANGVVLITTKKGTRGKTNAGLHFYQGAGQVTRTMELLNTQQWIEMRKEAFANDGVAMTNSNARDILVWDTTQYTNWQKKLMGGTAGITDMRATLSSGDEKNRFYFSSCYYRETSVFPGDFAFQKGSTFFNFGHEHNKRLKFNLTASYVTTKNALPQRDLAVVARRLIPNAPMPYNDKGELNFDTWAENPMALMLQNYEGKTGNVLANASLEYSLGGLELKSSFGYSGVQTEEWQKRPRSSFDPQLNPTGLSINGATSIATWIIEPQFRYKLKKRKHRLQFFLGTTFQETINKIKALSSSGYLSDEQLGNLLAAKEITIFEDNYYQYRCNGIFGRINYNYQDKYILNLTARRDGSTRTAPKRRFANFGAIGTSWIFTKEAFLGNALDWLSFGKLRASHGITGSDLIGDYQYYGSYSETENTYDGQIGVVPSRLQNPGYTWETSSKSEVAADIGLFNNRILLSVGYYHNRSSNLVAEAALPVMSGFPSVTANIPAVIQNSGIEITLNTVTVARDKFLWKTFVNVTVPRSKLLAYPNLEQSAHANRYVIGKPLDIQNKYHYTGLDDKTGMYTLQDVDGDGSVSKSDYLPLEKMGQDCFGGVQNTLQLYNFSLDFLVQFVSQTSYNYLALFLNQPGSRLSNQPTLVMERWQQEGDQTDVQRFTQRASMLYSNVANSDHAITDASLLRLKDLTLSWHPAGKLRNNIRFPDTKFYVQACNVFTFTPYKGYDPESLPTGALSPLRTLTAGIKITL